MAIGALVKRNRAAGPALQTDRLSMAIADNVLTDRVRTTSMGGIDPARMATPIEQTKPACIFTNAPDAALWFCGACPAGQRQHDAGVIRL